MPPANPLRGLLRARGEASRMSARGTEPAPAQLVAEVTAGEPVGLGDGERLGAEPAHHLPPHPHRLEAGTRSDRAALE
jgi:hypothetical protein